MTPDADLPVWSIRPNWRHAILERLQWLTEIETSGEEAEQAIAYRLSPRRSFEATFNPVGSARSYFDLWLHRFGHFEFMLPLWHDAGRLTAGIVAGATSIPVDTTYREFEVGDLAIMVGETPFEFDKVEIEAVAADSLTVVADGITRNWPKGATIYPLRRSRFAQESQVASLTNRVGEATILFELNRANDLPDEGVWDGIIYNDLPILTTRPNYREVIDMNFTRNLELLDNDLGLREIGDEAERAFTIQKHSFMLTGRAEQWAFRQMLYRLRGRQGAIWVPTYNEDFVLARDRLAADALLDINAIGYEYTGGVIDGRRHVLIAHTTPAEITAVGGELAPNEERLSLADPLGADYPAGTRGSFIDTCHLSQDAVEITHHTDTNGTAECNISFRSFANVREAPLPIHSPIPEAEMSDVECGAPSDPCATEIYNGPLVIQITIPDPLPTYMDDLTDWTNYLQVYLSLTVETPSGETLEVWNPPVVFFNTDAANPPPALGPFSTGVYDAVCDNVGWVTATGVLTPGLVTITCEIDNPHFKFAPNWTVPDPEDETWWDHPYSYGDWVGVNIVGVEEEWVLDSFASAVTISVGGDEGASAYRDEQWYAGGTEEPIHNVYRLRFVTSLT